MAKLNEQKVVLETFLREKVRETIVEEMMNLVEWDPSEWDEDPREHAPQHGDESFSEEDGPMMFAGPLNKWIDAHSWEQMYDPMGGMQDPENEMDPEQRKQMYDSLLSMEFDENKQIHLEHLNKMIREQVRKYLKANK